MDLLPAMLYGISRISLIVLVLDIKNLNPPKIVHELYGKYKGRDIITFTNFKWSIRHDNLTKKTLCHQIRRDATRKRP